MKKIFKKSTAMLLAMLMLFSVVGVTAIAASYKVEFLPGRYSTGTGPDPIVAEKNTVIILPGISFEREGYIQTGWATSASGSRKNYELNAEFTVTKATKLYPYWEAKKIQVTFAPGDFGIGDADVIEVASGRSVTAPGAIFSRDGYIMVGWSSVNGGDLELGLSDTTDPITEDITYYPVWEICDYSIDVDKTSENFGNVCVDFALPSAAHMTIENKGNVTLKYTLPVTSSYNVTVVSGSLNLEAGDSVTIAIQPKAGIGAGDYNMDLVFDCNFDVSDVVFNAFFSVSEHSYDRYISNGDATYEQDGTKTAQCSNGCGNTDIIVDEGSMKVYGAEFNTVDGLLKKYVHHRTVRATAYGSGTDNIREDGTIAVGTKRYRPVSWYVNEEFNGEFKNGNYDINFVHTSYGDYTLTVKYVEEVYTCDNHTGPVFFCEECGELSDEVCAICGAEALAIVCDICEDPTCGNVLFEDESEKTFGWAETGEEDEKSFDYNVSPTETEEEEMNSVSVIDIIINIFKKFFELIFG